MPFVGPYGWLWVWEAVAPPRFALPPSFWCHSFFSLGLVRIGHLWVCTLPLCAVCGRLWVMWVWEAVGLPWFWFAGVFLVPACQCLAVRCQGWSLGHVGFDEDLFLYQACPG